MPDINQSNETKGSIAAMTTARMLNKTYWFYFYFYPDKSKSVL
jgi:hypothetical protein